MNDVRNYIYGTIIGFGLLMAVWFSIIYVSACGFTFNCVRAQPLVIRTPVPTLIPYGHTENQAAENGTVDFSQCQVSATDLIGAWVTAGNPKTGSFPFTDVNGNPCEGTFAEDVQHLFVENSLWYAGSAGCTTCHNAELTERSAGLDLSSLDGILAGSNRSYEGARGTDILGGGNWDVSSLHDVLVVHGLVPHGHSPDAPPLGPIFLYAGQQAEKAQVTPTPTP
ncbi:MAG: hypothetical protein ABI621_15950 [Chloroflexota bacterium]